MSSFMQKSSEYLALVNDKDKDKDFVHSKKDYNIIKYDTDVICDNNSKEDILIFITKLKLSTLQKWPPLEKGNLGVSLVSEDINPETGTLYTYSESMELIPSEDSEGYKPDLRNFGMFRGMDSNSKDVKQMILIKEDNELLDNARKNAKRKMFRLIANEELKRGLIPISNKHLKYINKLVDVTYLEDVQKQDISLKKYGIRICITYPNEICDKVLAKIKKKIWVKNEFSLSYLDDKYILLVRYNYTDSKGKTSNRKCSMMMREILSTLKINPNPEIIGTVINKEQWESYIPMVE